LDGFHKQLLGKEESDTPLGLAAENVRSLVCDCNDAIGSRAEIDMVMNIPALKNVEQALFIRDIEGAVSAAAGKTVKVITENCYLTQEEKRRACEWIAQTGAHFVKTSTAYADGGATLEDVRLMHEVVNGRCRLKAAGGIREIDELLAYLRAGAERFGSTRTEDFVRAFQALPTDEEPDLCGVRAGSC
jgi:deoxyribose-phosphate aldolase